VCVCVCVCVCVGFVMCGCFDNCAGVCVICVLVNVNKNPTKCKSMQIFIHCKVTVRVSGVTAHIINTKNCNHNLRNRSYCKIEGLTGMN